MQRYTVINKPIQLFSGILDLSAGQSQPRTGQLTDLGDGLYSIKGAVEFKVGEEFGFDGDVSREAMQKLGAVKAQPETIAPIAVIADDANVAKPKVKVGKKGRR